MDASFEDTSISLHYVQKRIVSRTAWVTSVSYLPSSDPDPLHSFHGSHVLNPSMGESTNTSTVTHHDSRGSSNNVNTLMWHHSTRKDSMYSVPEKRVPCVPGTPLSSVHTYVRSVLTLYSTNGTPFLLCNEGGSLSLWCRNFLPVL